MKDFNKELERLALEKTGGPDLQSIHRIMDNELNKTMKDFNKELERLALEKTGAPDLQSIHGIMDNELNQVDSRAKRKQIAQLKKKTEKILDILIVFIIILSIINTGIMAFYSGIPIPIATYIDLFLKYDLITLFILGVCKYFLQR